MVREWLANKIGSRFGKNKEGKGTEKLERADTELEQILRGLSSEDQQSANVYLDTLRRLPTQSRAELTNGLVAAMRQVDANKGPEGMLAAIRVFVNIWKEKGMF